jgi:hypothetical protein
MTHLSLDQLVALREPGLEPGVAESREHLAQCPDCQGELARLDQRVARLRALPSLRPARGRWPAVRDRVAAERRRRWVRRAVVSGLAMAAGIALVLMVRRTDHRLDRAALAIDSVKARSSALERVLQSYNPDARVTDGTTALVAGQLEDRIALLDRQLEAAQMATRPEASQQVLQLWRQRVGLLDALVDVHLTRASQVGF